MWHLKIKLKTNNEFWWDYVPKGIVVKQNFLDEEYTYENCFASKDNLFKFISNIDYLIENIQGNEKAISLIVETLNNLKESINKCESFENKLYGSFDGSEIILSKDVAYTSFKVSIPSNVFFSCENILRNEKKLVEALQDYKKKELIKYKEEIDRELGDYNE